MAKKMATINALTPGLIGVQSVLMAVELTRTAIGLNSGRSSYSVLAALLSRILLINSS